MSKTLKKILVIGIFVLLALLFSPSEVKAATWLEEETGITWYYEVEDGNATNVYMNSYTTLPANLKIPEKIADTYPVTKIRGKSNTVTYGNGNRYNIFGKNTSDQTIKTVEFPDTLEEIGPNTFYYCRGITSLTIPSSVKFVGGYAFYYCSSIQDLTYSIDTKFYVGYSGQTTSSNYQQYYAFPFYSCSFRKITVLEGNKDFIGIIDEDDQDHIQGTNDRYYYPWNYGNSYYLEITIPEGVKKIDKYAFYSVPASKINLPETIEIIDDYAFYCQYSYVKSMNIPKNLKRIGDYAFYNNYNLVIENFELPENLEYLGAYSFYNDYQIKGNIKINDNVTVIGNSTFYNCYNLKSLEIGKNVERIDDKAFQLCKGFSNISIPENVTSIGNYAFYGCSEATGSITIGSGVTEIGNYAFYSCNKLEKLEMKSEVLTTIGNYAFYECYNLSGNVNIPDTVTELGEAAFSGCRKINEITVGTGISTIKKHTFAECKNCSKFVIKPGENVVTLEKFSIWYISDVYYDGPREKLAMSSTASGGYTPYVHYAGCTHKLTIDVPDGYQIIDKNTGNVLTTNDYVCGTKLNLGVIINGTVNPDLKVVIEKDGKYKNQTAIEEKIDLSSFSNYEISSMDRNYKVFIKDTSVTTDLVLRNYIYQVNYDSLAEPRTPIAVNQSGVISYYHTKQPLLLSRGDIITYKIRIYNEGNGEGLVNEVSTYLPEGIILQNSVINTKHGWVVGENGKVSTRYFATHPIPAYTGTGNVPYVEIPLVCKINAVASNSEELRLVSIAEITSAENKDTDSVYGQITERVPSDYMTNEAHGSTTTSYVRNSDDDTDFENVKIDRALPVEYKIKITKVDEQTNELLQGAVFTLKDVDGNVVSTASTNESGVLDFGIISSYGEGTDKYYIEETSTPEGYMISEKATIEVDVTKTIIDPILGTYSLRVMCQTLNYSTDITRYDFIPIATVEQLEKVGSGETIRYEGFDYVYSETSNYKLVNDIDLKGINWTPIDKTISGIFDGNGYAIKNLTIVPESDDYKFEYSEVGLFRSFSGIVQGLNLENVNINMSGMKPEQDGFTLDTISGYTCVGAFAGYMDKGTVKSCQVSGNIVSKCSNVGGFIGHSSENNILKFQNCTSSATIEVTVDSDISNETNGYTGYNVGGLIGCSIGALSVDDCTFEGEIKGNAGNVGALVGFVHSTDYAEYQIQAGYSEEDKEINLLVKNKKAVGKYDVILENRDLLTLGLVEGARYTVFDSRLQTMSGYEDIRLENGSLKIAEVDISQEGTDTYYIKEKAPAPGYTKLNTFVKVVVSRYWDKELERFRVSVETSNVTDSEIDNEERKPNYYKELESITGEVAPTISFENVGWNLDKVSIVDCMTIGNVTGAQAVSGMVGNSYSTIQIENCVNKGNISAVGRGKAAGMVAECRKNPDTTKINVVEVSNCINEGDILSEGGYNNGCVSGIVGESIPNVTVTNCVNKGTITGGYATAVSGMVADIKGYATIKSCLNEGDLMGTLTSDVNSPVGGMVAKNQLTYGSGSYYPANSQTDTSIYVTDCENTGDIVSANHCGGMVASSVGYEIVIQNCVNRDNHIKVFSGDTGGMVGFAPVKKLTVKNCATTNSEFYQVVGGQNTYGFTGGMVGHAYGGSHGFGTTGQDIEVVITNCITTDTIIKSRHKECAGIMGGSSYASSSNITITDCDVENCEIENRDGSGTYDSDGGIFGGSYNANNITIKDCNVKDSTVTTLVGGGGDTGAGGITGNNYGVQGQMKILGCNVENTKVYHNAPADGCANLGGMVAFVKSQNNPFIMEDCNVIDVDCRALSGNVGGMIGLLHETTGIITNCHAKGITVYSTSVTSSCSNTAGIIATAYNSWGTTMKLTNVSVTPSDNQKNIIYGRGRNTTAIVAMCPYILELTDVVVKDVDIESEGGNYDSGSCDTVAAVTGYVGNCLKLTNCNVENCDITGIVGNASGVSGTIGYGGNDGFFKNVTVKNCNITNTMPYVRATSNSSTSGICGSQSAYYTYEDCTVEDCNIKGSGSVQGGMVAVAHATGCGFKNCTLKNTKIERDLNVPNVSRGTISVGGLVASTQKLSAEGCTIDNVELAGDAYSLGGLAGWAGTITKLDDINATKVTISCPSEVNNGGNASIGGIIADVTSGFTANDCHISEFTAETGSNHIGGIIGTALSNTTMTNCTADQLNLTYKNEVTCQTVYGILAYKSVGGLFAVLSGTNNTIENCSVTNSDLTVNAGANATANAGSLVGWADTPTIKDSTATNNKIINRADKGMAGGLVGANRCSNRADDTSILERHGIVTIISTDPTTKTTTVSDCIIEGGDTAGGIMGYGVLDAKDVNVTSVTLRNADGSCNGVAGAIGIALAVEDSKLENIKVSNSTISSVGYAAGIAGYTSGSIKNCTVEGSTIASTSSSTCTGGIAGMIYDTTSEITGCTVKGTSIRGGTNVGGIAGLTEGSLSNDQVIENTTIMTTNGSDSIGVGGIVGLSATPNTQITGCTVNGSEVSGINGLTGGIAGFMNGTISGCTVDGVTVKALGGIAHGLGGILGHGSNDAGTQTVLTNNTVQNSTLTGKTGVGEVCGDGVQASRITGSTTSNNTVTSGDTGTGASLSSPVDETTEVENAVDTVKEDVKEDTSKKVEEQEEVSEEVKTTEDVKDTSKEDEVDTTLEEDSTEVEETKVEETTEPEEEKVEEVVEEKTEPEEEVTE